jgi:F-type H+-transporting ATPase subunit a
VAAGADGGIDPIHQFEVTRIGPRLSIFGNDLSFTNVSLFMAIVLGLVWLLMVYGTRQRSVVPGRLQAAAEMLYEFMADTVRSTTGKEGPSSSPSSSSCSSPT